MDTKEISSQIVLKILETNVLTFGNCPTNSDADVIAESNRKRVETICETYKTVYQTVLNKGK